jgi:hypothetical protein
MDRQRQWGRRQLVVAAIVLGLGLVAPAARSSAASPTGAHFVYELCDSALPGGNPPVASFVVNPGVPFTPFQTCGQPGGSIGIAETGATAAAYGYWGIAIPATPGGYVESITTSGSSSGLGPGNDHTYAYEQGWPLNGAGESKRVFKNSEGEEPFYFSEPGIRMLMNCDGNVPGGCGAGPTIAIHDIAADEVDLNPPTLSGIAGSLIGGGVIRGHQTLAAEAHDVGGGLSSLTLLANGLPAAAPDVGACRVYSVANLSVDGKVATSPTPCPTELKTSWTVDSQAYPFHDGANSVQVCAADYASLGNPNTTCSTPVAIDVDNSCTESPVAGGEALSAQFARSEKETITVGYGKGAEVTGELHDNAGDPISGATICVQSQTLGLQPSPLPVSTVTTDAGGHFSYEVPAGPDRELLLGYRHDSAQVARDVRYYAHAAPSLEANPPKLRNDSRVRLWGKLPRPSAGKRVVVLQANVVGSKRWITFRRATTDRHGDFETGYRFHSTTRRTEYRFRAIVPTQDHYPYVEGHSKPVSVLVRPKRHRR